MPLLNELESLNIPFGDIKEATKNFTTVIGKGGYGLVYKGELLLSGKLTSVAVKRLDGNVSGQGFKEFLTEIQMLTRYKHPNLISLIGFCDQEDEKILIYEHAEHGSLDNYLSTAENRSKLTWKRRINICVDAARGLNFLHNEVSPNERVIHRDIKSANVLLDRNWKAMISDLGLSKLGRANEKDTFLITNASGTHGYCDPAYISSGILTKESDVYSFGVVLFEVLCGRLCFINVNNEHRFLPPLAQRYCKIGKIDEIMDPALKNQIDSDSLNKFSKIASQCLQNNRKRRPSMRTVVKKLEELEKALEFHRQDTDQFKRSLDDIQNNLFISSHASDSMQRESLFKADEVEPDQHKSEHALNSEIAKFTDNGGLVDFEGVEKLIQLMQLESRKKNMDFACRVMLADVISVTDKNCLTQFVKSRGLHVLDEWLQEVNEGKIGDGTSIKGSNNFIEEFLFALLRAFNVLPVDLRALHSCNVRTNVNQLLSYKNSEIQNISLNLINKWNRIIAVELSFWITQSGISGGSGQRGQPKPGEGLSNLTVTGMKKALDSIQHSGPANRIVQADVDRFVEDGSLDDNVSHDDTDMRDTVGRSMDDSKEFTFSEVNSVRASQSKVVCCHFSSDGKLLASGGLDMKAVLWYTDSLKPKATLEEHTSIITDVRFSPSMPRLATSSFDKSVRVWDADNTGYSLRTFTGHSASVMSLDFHPNKDDLICSCDGDGEIRYWSISRGICARVFKGATTQVRFQPRLGRFLAAAAANLVSILDVDTQAVRYTLQGHTKPICSVCWDPSGEYLASVSENSVRVWSLTAGNEGECVHDLSCYGNQFHSCVFHPNYASLLVIGCYQSLELWNMSENKTMTLPAAHEGLIADLALSTSTGLIASASHDKIVKLWK